MSHLSFFGFDSGLLSGFDWTWTHAGFDPLEDLCSYVSSNYAGQNNNRLEALCRGPLFSTTMKNILFVKQFTATFGTQYSDVFCPALDNDSVAIDLTTISINEFIDFNLDVEVEFNVNLVEKFDPMQNAMIEFIQTCGFSATIDKILIQLTLEYDWSHFFGEFEAVFQFYSEKISLLLLDEVFVARILVLDANVIDSLGLVTQVFITQNIEVFFQSHIQFSIGGSFDWNCSMVSYFITILANNF